MTAPTLVLYHYPGACSQVPIYALEKAGLPYELKLVNLFKGEQNAPEYLQISPLGKVPMLIADGAPLPENAAILTYFAALRPEAGIFPADPAPRMRADIVGGLSFCGGTLHPIVRGLLNPQRVTTGEGEPVREMSRKLLTKSFGYAEARLEDRGWWLGAVSAVDVYLNWTVSVARKAGFDLAVFPHLAALKDRLREERAFVRMQELDQGCYARLGVPAS